MKAALAADKVVTLDSADTVADGCAVKTAGTLTFEFCKKYLDDIITVSEIDIMNALLSLIEKHKLVCAFFIIFHGALHGIAGVA